MANSILCDHCEALNSLDAERCEHCQRALFRNCQNCQTEIPRYYTRCPQCQRSTGRTFMEGGHDQVGRPEYTNKLIPRLRRLIARFLNR
jgi:predicted amidophosphoribosyltransferase